MKKFKIKGVLDGLRSSVNTPAKTELEITETLRSEHFEVCKVGKMVQNFNDDDDDSNNNNNTNNNNNNISTTTTTADDNNNNNNNNNTR